MTEAITRSVGSLEPFEDQVKDSRKSGYDLTGATVKFRIRAEDATTPSVDATATIVDPVKGTVSYSPSAPEVATEGLFMQWWHIIPATGGARDSRETPILFVAHSFGQGAQLGEIARRIALLIPVTFTSLRRQPIYSDAWVQRAVEVVKARYLPQPPAVQAEGTLDDFVIQHLARLTISEELATPGIEYWSSQPTSRTLRQSEENESFGNRALEFRKELERIDAMIARDTTAFVAIIGSNIETPSDAYPDIEATDSPVTADPYVLDPSDPGMIRSGATADTENV